MAETSGGLGASAIGRALTRTYLESVAPVSPQRSRTGWIYSDQFLRHNDSLNHPEQPDRLRAITSGLEATGLMKRLHPLKFEPGSDEQIGRVHTRLYLESLARSEGQYLDPDTYLGKGSLDVARRAAGGVMAAAGAVWEGDVANAFCAVRPPGHHALSDRAMGFCLLNNVALAAAAILALAPDAKILIVDWDVHHGNGTQAIFYESPQVMYASIHQYPLYPGTGAASETGRGPGNGFTVNVPLPAGSGAPAFLAALDSILSGPALTFAPDIVLVSAGFDAHRDDPLASLEVSTDGFATATRRVCDFARDHCQGRLVSILEGGYDLVALRESVCVHLAGLIEATEAGR